VPGPKGAQGERLAAARLAKLPRDEWFVFHDIPIGERDANVDHLVIGPGGVFSLNAKNHAGGGVRVAAKALLVNGQKTAYLSKARAEAERVGRHLRTQLGREVRVRGVVVVIADELTIKEQPSGVDVVSHRDIVRWLRRQKVLLSHADALGVAAAASRPTTWARSGGPKGM
jgi:Nuclease-related domain